MTTGNSDSLQIAKIVLENKSKIDDKQEMLSAIDKGLRKHCITRSRAGECIDEYVAKLDRDLNEFKGMLQGNPESFRDVPFLNDIMKQRELFLKAKTLILSSRGE